jgi:hypothetical protein
MSNVQPCAHSREFEQGSTTVDSINYTLYILVRSQISHVTFRAYDYHLELFTHGPILPYYIHIIYRHFQQNDIYGIYYQSLTASANTIKPL